MARLHNNNFPVSTILSFVLLTISFAPPAVLAADSYVEAGVNYDSLTNGYANWSGQYLNGAHKFAPRNSVYAAWLHTRRYDLTDDQFLLGGYLPLAERTTLLVEGTASSEHEFLPTWSTLAQVEQHLGNGWNVALGWLHRVYSNSSSDTARLKGERYWRHFRAAYTLSIGRSESFSSTIGHHVNGDYYYSDTSFVGLGFATGEEIDSVATDVSRSTVRTVYLRGRHMVAQRWGVSYQLHMHDQGDYYTRTGITLGLRYIF